MKKLLAIVVLGLLWSGICYADIIKLNQGTVVKIPKGFEYFQIWRKDYYQTQFNMNNVPQDLRESFIKENKEFWGYDGSEMVTLIGKKGFADLYGDLLKHLGTGRDISSWSRFNELSKKCGKKITAQSRMKCINNFLKIEPMFEVNVGNKKTDYIREIDKEINEIKTSDQKEIDKINNSMNDEIKYEKSVSLIEGNYKNIQNKKWGIEINTIDKLDTAKAKSFGYIFLHNGYQFSIRGFCSSSKDCKKIKKLNNQIIEPYLARYTQK